MVLTRAQCRQQEVGKGGPGEAVPGAVTARVSLQGALGDTPSKAAASLGGLAAAAAADGRLQWLSLIVFVFGAAAIFASISNAAFRLAAGAS